MFNARRGGLRVAVLYWLIEKTRRRTLELTAGLDTRRLDAFSLFCPAALLSSPAQVGHPSKLSRFAVKRVIFVQFPVTRVPARRGAPICRACPHTLTFPTADADFRDLLVCWTIWSRIPVFAAFHENLCGQQCFAPLGGSVAFMFGAVISRSPREGISARMVQLHLQLDPTDGVWRLLESVFNGISDSLVFYGEKSQSYLNNSF